MSANHLKATARDPEVRRARCFVKQEPGNASTEILQKKAEIIKEVNAGESDILTYKVQGWRQSNGELWMVNSFVYVVDSLVEEYGYLRKVIQGITYSLGSSGSTVALSLCNKLKFQLVVEPDAKKIKLEDNDDIKKNSGRIV